jgi:hypothetical protein
MNIFQRLAIAARLIYGDDLAVILARVAPPTEELQRFADGIVRNTQAALDGLDRRIEGGIEELRSTTEAINELTARITNLERTQAALLGRIDRGEQRLHILDQVSGLARPATGD